MEGVAALAAIGPHDHAHSQGGAGNAFLKRAQLVGNAFGQHGDDAVGEVDRVAAQIGFAVQRGAGTDVGSHVGDGDIDNEAAGIGFVTVGFGIDGVVVVLGIERIDGDQRHIAPVFAALERGLGGFVSLADDRRWEGVGDFEVVDGDHAHRPLGIGIADDGRDAGTRDHQAARELDLDFHQIAICGSAEIAQRNAHFLLLAIDGDQAGAFIIHADNADLAATRLIEDLHRAGGIDRDFGLASVDAGQNAVAGSGRNAGIATLHHADARTLTFLVIPLGREGVEMIGIGIGRDVKHGHRGQGCRTAECLARARDDAFAFQFGQHGLEGTPHIAANAEHLGKIALALDVGFIGEGCQQLLARRQLISLRLAGALGAGRFFGFLSGNGHQSISWRI